MSEREPSPLIPERPVIIDKAVEELALKIDKLFSQDKPTSPGEALQILDEAKNMVEKGEANWRQLGITESEFEEQVKKFTAH